MIGDDKEVYYNKFCLTCEYYKEDEFDPNTPCYICLQVPYNQDTHKPVNWKERKERKPRKNPPLK